MALVKAYDSETDHPYMRGCCVCVSGSKSLIGYEDGHPRSSQPGRDAVHRTADDAPDEDDHPGRAGACRGRSDGVRGHEGDREQDREADQDIHPARGGLLPFAITSGLCVGSGRGHSTRVLAALPLIIPSPT
jgi:hypothetical protein